jgi:carbon-monoxide dehydrogenase medium subunit
VRSFQYLRPTSLDEAVAALVEHGPSARLLAGGTDLVVRMRTGHTQPSVVIDLKRVAGLTADISDVSGGIRIGARAVMTDVIADGRVREQFPALVEAASVVGSVQIRNRATLTGNICNASPAADTAPALLAYGAAVNLTGPAGARQVALTEFFTGPGRTVLTPGEIVTSVDLPRPASPAGGAFGRVTRRRGVDLATVNLVVVVTSAGEARCAYGAVGPRPFLVVDASGALASRTGDAVARRRAIERLSAAAAPITDVRGSREYRQAMLTVMTERTWLRAIERLEASGRPGVTA